MTVKPQIKFDPAVLELIPQDCPVWVRFETLKPGDLLLIKGVLFYAHCYVVVSIDRTSFCCYSLVNQHKSWSFKESLGMRYILSFDQVLEYNRTHHEKPLLVRSDHLAEMIDITVVI